MIKSKFEKIYIVKQLLIPSICVGLGLLLIDVKLFYKPNVDVTYTVTILFIIGFSVLFYCLNSLYKIEANDESITIVNILSRKKRIINYSEIVEYKKEFVDGYYSPEVGKLTAGYYCHNFILKSNEILRMSPEYYTNNIELVNEINHHKGFS